MPEEPDSSLTEVFVISDGTGETCAAAVRAAMLQFQAPWRLRIFGGVRHESELRRVMAQAAESRALVVFSLVEGKIVTFKVAPFLLRLPQIPVIRIDEFTSMSTSVTFYPRGL